MLCTNYDISMFLRLKRSTVLARIVVLQGDVCCFDIADFEVSVINRIISLFYDKFIESIDLVKLAGFLVNREVE